jgi:hypothetical protein
MFLEKVWKHLVLAVRILSGDSQSAVPPEAVRKSRLHMTKFFTESKSMFGESVCSFKMHAALHIPDDVETFGNHLDAINAFPFENMLRVILRVSQYNLLKIFKMFSIGFAKIADATEW